MKKKNCLNCAFLVRHQETYKNVAFKPELSRWIVKQTSLDTVNRCSIKEGDLSFLGKSLREYQKWQKQYEQKKQRVPRMSPALLIPNLTNGGPSDDELAYLGLSQPPAACDHDYLKCYHEQWAEGKNRESSVNYDFLKNKVCCFYFSQERMERKSLEACEKTRMHEKNHKRFLITNILVVLGILSTLALSQNVQEFIGKTYKYVKQKISEPYKK